jgi:hypothetical protein
MTDLLSIMYIPTHHPILSLSSSGEFWHPRLKIPFDCYNDKFIKGFNACPKDYANIFHIFMSTFNTEKFAQIAKIFFSNNGKYYVKKLNDKFIDIIS